METRMRLTLPLALLLAGCASTGPIEESPLYFADALQSPNGGERWVNGASENINWDTAKIQGDNVELFVLYDNPAGLVGKRRTSISEQVKRKNWHLFASTENTGNFSVDPAKLNGNGNAYLVMVRSDTGEFDISDGTFSLNQ